MTLPGDRSHRTTLLCLLHRRRRTSCEWWWWVMAVSVAASSALSLNSQIAILRVRDVRTLRRR